MKINRKILELHVSSEKIGLEYIMKGSSAREGEEYVPSLIEEANYLVFKSANLEKISNSSSDSLLLEDSILEEVWGWQYSRFSKNKLIWMRSLYSIAYAFEAFCFVLSVFLSDIKNPPHTNTPFTVDPYFKIVSWAICLALGFPFIKVTYTNTVSSINLVSWNINLLYLPVYFFLSTLFIHRSVPSYDYSLITELITIVFAMVFVLIIYIKVKYKDDGRYKVAILEFLGVQVHFSALLACLLVEICEAMFQTFGYYEHFDTNTSTLFDWENENWTILVMTLTWWTGCLILYLYKDVFYSFILGFTYFGIYCVQMRLFCPKQRGGCSKSVTQAAITLGSLLFFFILITVITYPKLVLYSVRKH